MRTVNCNSTRLALVALLAGLLAGGGAALAAEPASVDGVGYSIMAFDTGPPSLESFGVTHGNEGKQTVLRTFRSNQAAGIVDDDVFELKLQPGNWGEVRFEE